MKSTRFQKIRNCGSPSSIVTNRFKTNWFDIFQTYWIALICLTGAVYQMAMLAIKYFEKDVAHEVRSEVTFISNVPRIMVCATFRELFNWKLLIRDHPLLFNGSCLMSHNLSEPYFADCVSSLDDHDIGPLIVHNFDLNSILPYIRRPEEVISTVTVKGSDDLLANGICSFTNFLRYPEVCYAINCKNGSKYLQVNRDDPYIRLAQGATIRVTLVNTVFAGDGNFNFHVIPQGSPLREIEVEFGIGLIAKPNVSTAYLLKYARILMYELPAPYKTNCQNYDRHSLITNCLNNITLAHFNSPYPRRLISTKNYRDRKIKLIPGRVNKTRDKLMKFHQLCQSLYPYSNCFTEIFSVNLLTEALDTPLPFAEKNIVIVEAHGPEEPDLVFFVRPKLLTNDWFILMFSVLGFWFGLNVHYQLHKVNRIKTKIAPYKDDLVIKKSNQINYGIPIYSKESKPSNHRQVKF